MAAAANKGSRIDRARESLAKHHARSAHGNGRHPVDRSAEVAGTPPTHEGAIEAAIRNVESHMSRIVAATATLAKTADRFIGPWDGDQGVAAPPSDDPTGTMYVLHRRLAQLSDALAELEVHVARIESA